MGEIAQLTAQISIQTEDLENVWSEAYPIFQAHWQETEGYQTFPLIPDLERVFAYNKGGYLRYYTVRSGAKIVAHSMVHIAKSLHTSMRVANEDGFYVAEDFRGQGIAQTFLEFIEEDLKQIGVREFRFATKLAAPGAEKLVERADYQLFAKEYVKVL